MAEVLITLGIVGVIAALTLPPLIQNYKKVVASARLKKFNSVFSNMIKMSTVENGEPETWLHLSSRNPDTSVVSSEDYVNKYLKPYIKTVKVETASFDLGSGNVKDCNIIIDTNDATMMMSLRKLNISMAPRCGGTFSGDTRFILNDGSIIYLKVNHPNYIPILYDINGKNAPNTLGKDRFLYYFAGWGLPQVSCLSNAYLCAQGRSLSTGLKPQRDEAKIGCENNGELCTILLEYDGWEFKKDYPIKL